MSGGSRDTLLYPCFFFFKICSKEWTIRFVYSSSLVILAVPIRWTSFSLTWLISLYVSFPSQSTGDLRGAGKVQTEKQIQSVIREVTLELKSARAPRHKPKLTDRAKQNMVSSA